ncbi:MAG: hypothetical protein KDD82_19405 [Planctomycetes bacterium]|nr:hypothetical protein [Planctomycetota bacterium]
MSTITAIAASWKTTALGALQVIAAAVMGLLLLLGGTIPEPAVMPMWAVSVASLLNGLGSVLGRDADVTSEQGGLQ